MRVAFLLSGVAGLQSVCVALSVPIELTIDSGVVRCSAATHYTLAEGPNTLCLTGRASKLGDCQSAHASLDLLLPLLPLPPPPPVLLLLLLLVVVAVREMLYVVRPIVLSPSQSICIALSLFEFLQSATLALLAVTPWLPLRRFACASRISSVRPTSSPFFPPSGFTSLSAAYPWIPVALSLSPSLGYSF
uniref:Putative secreted protein n=1 Tax=Anopheles darlingi TaxID=43151 RepID=A0A2M4D0D3_ANODA